MEEMVVGVGVGGDCWRKGQCEGSEEIGDKTCFQTKFNC